MVRALLLWHAHQQPCSAAPAAGYRPPPTRACVTVAEDFGFYHILNEAYQAEKYTGMSSMTLCYSGEDKSCADQWPAGLSTAARAARLTLRSGQH